MRLLNRHRFRMMIMNPSTKQSVPVETIEKCKLGKHIQYLKGDEEIEC